MHVDVCGCTMRLAVTLLAALIMSPISPGRERVGGPGRRHGEMPSHNEATRGDRFQR